LAVIASTDNLIDSSGYSILTGRAMNPTYSRARLIAISFIYASLTLTVLDPDGAPKPDPDGAP
jgi:hypothetical protein